MMLKVLIAVDGSTIGKRTLEFARDLLAGKETAVTLFHVIQQQTDLEVRDSMPLVSCPGAA
jgi:nucleotide-binding universal stress UspA family protein